MERRFKMPERLMIGDIPVILGSYSLSLIPCLNMGSVLSFDTHDKDCSLCNGTGWVWRISDVEPFDFDRHARIQNWIRSQSTESALPPEVTCPITGSGRIYAECAAQLCVWYDSVDGACNHERFPESVAAVEQAVERIKG